MVILEDVDCVAVEQYCVLLSGYPTFAVLFFSSKVVA